MCVCYENIDSLSEAEASRTGVRMMPAEPFGTRSPHAGERGPSLLVLYRFVPFEVLKEAPLRALAACLQAQTWRRGEVLAQGFRTELRLSW